MKIPYLTVILATLLLNGCSDGTSPDSNIVAASMAQRIAAGEDHITVVELADRLMKDRPNFELIDIRDEQDFYSGHIQGARHIPLARLIDQDSLVSLPPGRSIVVYSNGTAHAAQAALLLHLTGRDALALLGGYNYWQAWLHDPEKAGIAEMDPAERKRYQAVSCYFAGNYVADAGLQPEGTVQTEGPIMLVEQQADPLGLGLGLGSEQVQEMDLQNVNTDTEEADPLGLGLGSEQVQEMNLQDTTTHAEEADPLGLGLEPGLGGDAAESTSTSADPPKGETQRLLIRKEC
ncbi:MAG: rhodanese-like domain-containing protein [Pseudomonadota bacterium]